jgi:DNA ligase-1
MLATDWDSSENPKGWWMTEKYDGLRALWDGRYLYSRLGRMIKSPEFFTEGLPSIALDGELW